VVDEQHQQLQGEPFHPQGLAVARELKTAEIQLKFGESHSFAGHVRSDFCYEQFLSASRCAVKISADSSDKLILLQRRSMDVLLARVQDRITS
jgi:hypothetical protein